MIQIRLLLEDDPAPTPPSESNMVPPFETTSEFAGPDAPTVMSAEIAVTRGTMPPGDREALASLIAKMGPLPAVADVPIAEVLEAIGHDKKVVAGQLHFVLPTSIGTCEVVTDVTREEIAGALTRCCKL